jgi:hypothetical protein
VRPLGDQPLHHTHRPVRVDVALDQHLERLARGLVTDIEQLRRLPLGGLVELKSTAPT